MKFKNALRALTISGLSLTVATTYAAPDSLAKKKLTSTTQMKVKPTKPVKPKPTPTPTPTPEPTPTPTPEPTPTPTPEPTPTPTPTPIDPTVQLGSPVTDMQIENTSSTSQQNVPFTMGQPFVKGNFLPKDGLAGKLADGTIIPLQVDVKALHTDGSVRHAIISGVLPSLAAGASASITLTKATLSQTTVNDILPSDLAQQGVSAQVNLVVDGASYSVSLADLLKSGKYKTWLKGPIATEFLVSSALKAADGTSHPHLAARFAVRSYRGLNKTKIDVILENGWAYEVGPRDFTYDINVSVGGQNVYSKAALAHYSHARWHKNFWSGGEPKVNVKHNTAYLIQSKAVPNYDQSLKISETTLANLSANFAKSNIGPMGNGLSTAYMPTTGGRPDIGLNPSWNVMTLLSMDKRAKEVTLGMGDLGGSWGTHFRDKTTDEPVSLVDHPNMTAIGGTYADINPVTKVSEYLPPCQSVCNNTNTADVSHQPNHAYIPYLLSGEHFYKEELEFYGMWNVGTANPAYREYGKGILKYEQVRGQAWALRAFVDAAYILPEDARLKGHFKNLITENMNWYNANYTNNANANVFGVLTNGYAMAYNSGSGMAPWQDDFFTSAVGRAAEYEFPGAMDLLKYKAKYTVGRMTDPGTCWILATNYSMNIRSSSSSPFFTNWKDVYLASSDPTITSTQCASTAMAQAIQAITGTPMVAGAMVGYPTSPEGYAANMQPAAAFTKDSGISNAATAWQIFDGRASKPDYSAEPQFAIIPRTK